jgi:hypothetical protein
MRKVMAFGGTEIVTTDAPRYDWRDPYHALLAMGWGPFLLGVLTYYLNQVYFENRTFSSSGSRWSLIQRRSATAQGC